MISFKEGVKVTKVQPVIFEAIAKVSEAYVRANSNLTVTSISDGEHMQNSFHYKGLAFDCRIWGFQPIALTNLLHEIRAVLGEDFDVVLEKDHIHVEYDPE